MTFKIATWNVNSLRVRLPHVLQWLAEHQPDVLALQEIKMPDNDFPLQDFQHLGYQACISGQKTYNGVAILSRSSCGELVRDIPGFDDHQRRVLGVTLQGLRIFNLYVPNGESTTSEKYLYKLNWLQHLTRCLKEELQKNPNLIILGDFNIAPDPQDVHDPSEWEGRVLFSESERSALKNLFDIGFIDCFRLFPQPEKSFSWWDYRLNSFKRNRGLRIDHILVNQELKEKCVRCYIDTSPRTLERPSDHAPVILELSS